MIFILKLTLMSLIAFYTVAEETKPGGAQPWQLWFEKLTSFLKNTCLYLFKQYFI